MSPVTGLKNTFWDFAWLKRIYSRVRRAGRSGTGVVVVVLVAFIIIGLFGFLLVQDVAGSNKIFKGVTIGGKAAGGMTRSSAQSLLTRDITDPLSKPMRVYYGKSSYPMNPSGIDYTIDTKAMVDEAYAAGHGKNVFQRMWWRLTGKPLQVSVPLIARYDSKKLKAFLVSIANELDYAPRNASIEMPADHKPIVHDSKDGMYINIVASQKKIAEALQKPERNVALVAEIKKPKVTTADLGTIVVVSQSEHKVRQYSGETLVDTYPCAVGEPKYPTPNGSFTIVEKKYKPTWYPPNSDWAKGKAAIPPGPGNPLGPYWMGIGNGVGLHSTYDEGSLGYSASHGCIRMSEYNAMMLFKAVKEGTPVYIYP